MYDYVVSSDPDKQLYLSNRIVLLSPEIVLAISVIPEKILGYWNILGNC